MTKLAMLHLFIRTVKLRIFKSLKIPSKCSYNEKGKIVEVVRFLITASVLFYDHVHTRIIPLQANLLDCKRTFKCMQNKISASVLIVGNLFTRNKQTC